jgi:hypothetical protein
MFDVSARCNRPPLAVGCKRLQHLAFQCPLSRLRILNGEAAAFMLVHIVDALPSFVAYPGWPSIKSGLGRYLDLRKDFLE